MNAQDLKGSLDQPAVGTTYVPYFRWEGGKDVAVKIKRHAISAEHELHRFTFPGDSELECPDCLETFLAADLGQAVDWALTHECEQP